jgi:hypothetical protein
MLTESCTEVLELLKIYFYHLSSNLLFIEEMKEMVKMLLLMLVMAMLTMIIIVVITHASIRKYKSK